MITAILLSTALIFADPSEELLPTAGVATETEAEGDYYDYTQSEFEYLNETYGWYDPPIDISIAVHEAEYRYGVPSELMIALIWTESRYDANAGQRSKYKGLCQLGWHWFTPELSNDPYDIRNNVYTAAKWVGELHTEHDGDMTKILTHYNTGHALSNSTAYSRKVNDIYEHLLAMRGKERRF
jgi:soluble lytic murein transglycosylase-like protein